MGTIVIKAGREKSIRRQHPWIFSGAIEKVQDDPAPGAIVTVVDGKDRFLARGYWNAKSQIQVRILTWQDEIIDEGWWQRMLARAIDARALYNEARRQTALDEGYRVINAENDFLPGLIVDRYGDWAVLQALTLHIDQHKMQLAHLILDLFQERGIPLKGIYERSDVDVRRKEGLSELKGLLLGEEPPDRIQLGAEGLRYGVDIRNGHKTGTYLDQRPNHHLLSQLVADKPDTRLLNLFSYTGRFGLGISGTVVNVDASHEALELADTNFQLSWPADRLENVEFIQADVFDYLHDQVAEKAQYDVIICDPPKFAHNAGQVERAARGYKDLNLNCFKLLKSGGYLMTFSCSGAITQDLFQKIVFGALEDSGRQAQIIQHLGPGPDHPVALTFPEGAYLKGLLLRVY